MGDAAEVWGAGWQTEDAGGLLTLPVVQGVRQGVVYGRIDVAPSEGGTSLSFKTEDALYKINKSALAILLLGALGGLTVVLWPLSPRILQLAPIGVVLALVAWLLVVSRLRSSGIDDFLDLTSELATLS